MHVYVVNAYELSNDGNIASFCMNNFWGPLKLNLPRAPNVLRPALVVVSYVCLINLFMHGQLITSIMCR